MKRYNLIVENIKRQIRRSSFNESSISLAFVHCGDSKKLSVLEDLYGVFSKSSEVYFEVDGELLPLKNYTVPDGIIEFYRENEPNELPCLTGDIYLLDLEGIRRENSSLAPGAYLIKYGLLTFATTIGGNAVCMDLNAISNGEPRIIYADKSWFYFDKSERKVVVKLQGGILSASQSNLTNEIVSRYLPEISSSFTEFMMRLSNEEFGDIENFYDEIGSGL